ncbi:MAG: recombination regulator RecX [Tepidiphilus sp.]|jgi:regulatory protein|nr:recombination regulator RecX [Tepidiphilus sp.]
MAMSGPSVWQRALRLLARREHSRAELARKLAPHGTPEEIAEALARLERTGLLSDERCARAFVAARAERSGRRLLELRLRERGLDDALIDEVLDALEAESSEVERAAALWRKRFGTPPADAKEWARQARFLASRGFSPSIVTRLLRDPPEDFTELFPDTEP